LALIGYLYKILLPKKALARVFAFNCKQITDVCANQA